MIIATCLLILVIVALWQIFVKAGKPGWYGIIPYYNTYELAKLAFKDKKWHWITLAAVVVMTMSSWISTMFAASAQSASSVSVLMGTHSIISFAVLAIMTWFNINLARAFGKETAFGVGLAFLPVIFYPILAFGSAEYKGFSSYESYGYDGSAPINPHQTIETDVEVIDDNEESEQK